MKARVLCPGPSLAGYASDDFAGLVLGVNRAAAMFAVDAWVCGDTPLIEGVDPKFGRPLHEAVIGAPILVTYGVTMDTLRDHGFTWRGPEIFSWSTLAQSWLHTSIVNWPWCSFTSAIVYAAWRGATEIEVYGADWSGKADFDGVEAGKNRSVERWREEQSIYERLKSVLAERGCVVTRV